MDIHEYQAKDILSKFGVDIAPGALAYSPEQATYRARELRREMGCQSTGACRADAARPGKTLQQRAKSKKRKHVWTDTCHPSDRTA